MNNEATTSETRQWTAASRACASVLVVLHLFAVFAAPWGSPAPSSGLAQSAGYFVRPYTQTLAIDNGYRYFAPEPEAAHIVRYVLTGADGTTTRGEFPDRKQHWPRLLYHRHFMLSESLFQRISSAPDLPPDLVISEQERASYDWQRKRAELMLRSLADGLLAENPTAESVELTLHEHEIPTPAQVINGLKLTDESLYDESITLGVFRRETR